MTESDNPEKTYAEQLREIWEMNPIPQLALAGILTVVGVGAAAMVMLVFGNVVARSFGFQSIALGIVIAIIGFVTVFSGLAVLGTIVLTTVNWVMER